MGKRWVLFESIIPAPIKTAPAILQAGTKPKEEEDDDVHSRKALKTTPINLLGLQHANLTKKNLIGG